MRHFLRYSALFIGLFLIPFAALASAGIWRGSLDINLDGIITNYREGSGTGTPFASANLGSITNTSTFKLQDPYLFSFKNGGCDVTGADFYYRVYKMGNTPGAYTNVSFGFACSCGSGCWRNSVSGCGTNDQEWGSSSTIIDLLAAAKNVDGSAGTYVLDVYWTINVAACAIPPALGSVTATFTATTSLPIELTAFHAARQARTVDLTWATATELNNDHFEVECSVDGSAWSLLAVVPTQNGNARFAQTYSMTDQHPRPVRNYYRLRQVDRDGKSSLSTVRMVEMDGRFVAAISPNPVQDGMLQLTLPAGEAAAHVRLLDIQGHLLRTWTFDAETELTVPLDLTGVPAGVFFLQVNSDTPLRVAKK